MALPPSRSCRCGARGGRVRRGCGGGALPGGGPNGPPCLQGGMLRWWAAHTARPLRPLLLLLAAGLACRAPRACADARHAAGPASMNRLPACRFSAHLPHRARACVLRAGRLVWPCGACQGFGCALDALAIYAAEQSFGAASAAGLRLFSALDASYKPPLRASGAPRRGHASKVGGGAGRRRGHTREHPYRTAAAYQYVQYKRGVEARHRATRAPVRQQQQPGG